MESAHQLAQQLRAQQAAKTAPVTAADLSSVLTRTLMVPTSAGTIPVYAQYPHFHTATGMVINLHGSGFIFPHNDRDTLFCKRLCLAANLTVFDVDYPLAPEHPFPVPLQATYEVVQFLTQRYHDQLGWPTLIGHSAGGNLAIGTQLLARRQDKPLARQVILDYPALDLDTDPREKSYPAGAADHISAKLAQQFNAFYRPDGETGNPLISPVTAQPADLQNFPRTFILTADHDTLMAEAERFGQLLVAANVAVTTHRYPNSHHGFTVGGEGAAAQAFQDILAWL